MDLIAKEFCGNQKNKLILKAIRKINAARNSANVTIPQ